MTNHLRTHSPEATPRTGASSTHAKAILLGEHAVVYGAPALAVPVPAIRVTASATALHDHHRLESAVHTGPLDTAPNAVMPTVTAVTATIRHLRAEHERLHVRVASDIPTARGLGSSAAVAAAVIGAVADALGATLTAEELFSLTQECERIAHGRPSGLDARTVVAETPLWFQDGSVEVVDAPTPMTLVVADTGVPGHTRAAVSAVRAAREAEPEVVDGIIEALAALAGVGRSAVIAGDVEALGSTMDAAHELLASLDISSPDLDRLVAAARAAGALGAKLTGGGRGGCMLALAADPHHAERLVDALRAAGASATWITWIGEQ